MSEGIVVWADVKKILEELEKSLLELADQNPNWDQRSAFLYSSGCVHQKLHDLGLEDPAVPVKPVGSVVQRKQ